MFCDLDMHMDFFPLNYQMTTERKRATKAFASLITEHQLFFSYVSRQELNRVYLDLLRLFYTVKPGRDFIHSEMLYHALDVFLRCYNPQYSFLLSESLHLSSINSLSPLKQNVNNVCSTDIFKGLNLCGPFLESIFLTLSICSHSRLGNSFKITVWCTIQSLHNNILLYHAGTTQAVC